MHFVEFKWDMIMDAEVNDVGYTKSVNEKELSIRNFKILFIEI